jgi:ketosteroid isomerase-like protein
LTFKFSFNIANCVKNLTFILSFDYQKQYLDTYIYTKQLKNQLIMKTQEIANNLVEWCNKGDYAKCYQELYSPDIVSLEPSWAEHSRSEGMEAVGKKGEWWENTFDVHSTTVSEPTVAENWFSVRFDMDTTHKPSGQRSKSSEIAVYQVKDGKIVQEQFFYDMPGQ